MIKNINKILLETGYNGIKYRINSLGLDKKTDYGNEYNVVIIDDSIINIINVKKVEFEGLLVLKHI